MLCLTIITPNQPAVLIVMPHHTHSPPAGHEDSFVDPPHTHPTGRAQRYAGYPYSTPTGRADVMPDHPHSPPSGRVDHYAGPSSLLASRPCRQLCRPLTHFQPAVLTVMPVLLTPHQPAFLTVMPDPPYSLPTDRTVRYAGPSTLHSNRLW